MPLTALEALDRSWQPARSVELDDLRLQVDRVERRSLAGCRLHNLGSGQQAAAGPRWRGGSARIVSANELSCSERATMCELPPLLSPEVLLAGSLVAPANSTLAEIESGELCGRREPVPLAAGGVRVLAAHIGIRAALWPAPLLHSRGHAP